MAAVEWRRIAGQVMSAILSQSILSPLRERDKETRKLPCWIITRLLSTFFDLTTLAKMAAESKQQKNEPEAMDIEEDEEQKQLRLEKETTASVIAGKCSTVDQRTLYMSLHIHLYQP